MQVGKIDQLTLGLDKRLYKVARSMNILETLKWSPHAKHKFLKNWEQGTPSPPVVRYQVSPLEEQQLELRSIIKACDKRNPLQGVLRETAQSYLASTRMLQGIGTNNFLKHSIALYGLPKDPFNSGRNTTLKAANSFLRQVRKFNIAELIPDEAYCITPDFVARRIKKAAKRKFPGIEIKVVTDKRLPSKASATVKRIRIRHGTCFAEHDIQQLIQHELFVHVLTTLNGRNQKLKVLGLNSPRNTISQEGLAMFSEFITNAMDVRRLARISGRVRAIQMGIEGADFIQVFEYFLNLGQSIDESFFSAQRVFRGGDPKGSGIVFTKDIVYLRGFIEVHNFFLRSLEAEQYLFPSYFVSGRMNTSDVSLLEPYFKSGLLSYSQYEPDWLEDRSTLLAFLLSSSVMNNLGLSQIN
jgi:uncharacterized protein (TIGR02421 family)